MLKPNEMEIQQMRYADMYREAEQSRLLHREESENDEKNAERFYAPVLAKVGGLMVELGTELQNRYGELVEQPNPLPDAG